MNLFCMRRSCFLSILILTLTLQTATVSIKAQNIKFKHFGTEMGLSHSNVLYILQDKEGLMWFGTYDGLNMYDGYDFKVFKYNRKDSTTLSDSRVNVIVEDNSGTLWVGTQSGLNRFNRKTQTFKRYMPGEGKGDLKSGNIVHLALINDSILFISTGNGLSLFNNQTDEFITFLPESEGKNSINSAVINSVTQLSDGTILVCTDKSEIQEFNLSDNSFSSFLILAEEKENNTLRTVFEDDKGNLWISSNVNGLVRFDRDENSLTSYNSGLPNGVSKNQMRMTNFQSKDRKVWFPIENNGGLNVYDYEKDAFEVFYKDDTKEGSLSSSSIFCAMEDDKGRIWVGTFAGGVNVYDPNLEKFTSYFHDKNDAKSISDNPVLSAFQDSQGRVWIGNDWGGLNLFDTENTTFSHFTHDENDSNSLSVDVIISIAEAPNGNLLLGTYSGGMMLYDVDHHQMKVFMPNEGDNAAIASEHVWSFCVDRKNRIWVGTLNQGLEKFDPITGTFEHYGPNTDREVKVNEAFVTKIIEGKDNKLWIATLGGGVNIFDADANTMEFLMHNEEDENSIISNNISTIYYQNDSTVWIGSMTSGMSRYNPLTKTFKHYTVDEGLPVNAIASIEEDNNGHLWISTSNGLTVFNPQSESFKTYDVNDGIQDNFFKDNASFKLTDGTLLFGGNGGLTVFHPDSIHDNSHKPEVVFTDLKLFNKAIDLSDDEAPIDEFINYADIVKLNHKQSVFSIQFAALNYTSPEKNQYKYILEGFHDDWIDNGNQRTASFTNIDPGKYTFKVIASNNDGVWNEDGKSVQIIVKAAWYNTLLFKLFVLILLVYAAYRVVNWRIEQNRRDKEVLNRKVKEGEKKIEENLKELDLQKKALADQVELDKESKFERDGLAEFGEILATKRKNLAELCQTVISKITPMVGAEVGAVFILNKDESELDLIAHYSYNLNEGEKRIFKPGEGYVGTCFSNRELLEVNNLPKDYIVLSSGLGELWLSNLLLVPIMDDNSTLGVIELGSIEELPKSKRDFVLKVCANIGSIVAISKTTDQLNDLLEANSFQTEEIKAQEEELKQTLEEMLASNEEMERQVERLEKIEQAYEKSKIMLEGLMESVPAYTFFKDLEGKYQKASKSMLKILALNSQDEIIGRSDLDFFPEETAKQIESEDLHVIRTKQPLMNKEEVDVSINGRHKWLSISKIPMIELDGSVSGILGVMKDVTEQKKLQKQILKLQKDLDRRKESQGSKKVL